MDFLAFETFLFLFLCREQYDCFKAWMEDLCGYLQELINSKKYFHSIEFALDLDRNSTTFRFAWQGI